MSKKRKLNRLRKFDYNQQGYYYLTICTKNRAKFFAEVSDNNIALSRIGKIANKFWIAIPEHFQNIELDEYIIMPEHIHGIIIVNNDAGNADLPSFKYVSPQCSPNPKGNDSNRSKMLISKIIHGFKSSATREIRKQFPDCDFEWQKSYYDHIIRDSNDLDRIREYITDNPRNWKTDMIEDVGD